MIPFEGARPTGGRRESVTFDDDGSSEGDDFIVDDEDDGPVSLPPQFSMDSHQDLAHHFKLVFQFFVHIAVRPGEERHDFMKDEMSSQFSSLCQCINVTMITSLGRLFWNPPHLCPKEGNRTSRFPGHIFCMATGFQAMLGELSGVQSDHIGVWSTILRCMSPRGPNVDSYRTTEWTTV
jgi:hypothetical protein